MNMSMHTQVDGNLVVVIRTGHNKKWWAYLAENNEQIAAFVKKYLGGDAQAAFAYALLSYNDETLIALLTRAFDECPDDVTLASCGERNGLTAVYRLIENDFTST